MTGGQSIPQQFKLSCSMCYGAILMILLYGSQNQLLIRSMTKYYIGTFTSSRNSLTSSHNKLMFRAQTPTLTQHLFSADLHRSKVPKSRRKSRNSSTFSCRGGSRIFQRGAGGGGVHLRSTSKKRGTRRGPFLGPMLRNLHNGPKGGPPAWTPTPTGSAHVMSLAVSTL